MSLFEYVVIAFALLFTAAAMRLIGGLSTALAPGKRYWVHSAFTCIMLPGIAVGFWNLWALSEIEWTLPRFLLALLIPATNYYIATVLVPENPADVASWREYYYSVRTRYFGGFLTLLVIQAVSARLLLGMAWTDPVRIGDVAFMSIALTGLVSANPRVHAAIVAVFGGMFLVMVAIFATQPDWLAQ